MFTGTPKNGLRTREQLTINEYFRKIGQWLDDEKGVNPSLEYFDNGDITLVWRHYGLDIALLGLDGYIDFVVIEDGSLIHISKDNSLSEFSVDDFLQSYKPKSWKDADAATKVKVSCTVTRLRQKCNLQLFSSGAHPQGKYIRSVFMSTVPASDYRRGLWTGIWKTATAAVAIVILCFIGSALSSVIPPEGGPVQDMIERTGAKDNDLLAVQIADGKNYEFTVSEFPAVCVYQTTCPATAGHYVEVCVAADFPYKERCAFYDEWGYRDGDIRNFSIRF